MTRLALFAAALVGAAVWLSQATLAMASADGPRLALLPTSAFAFIVVSCSIGAIVLLARLGATLAPLLLLSFLVLPWLPFPVPASFLVWAGSIKWFLWAAAVAISLVVSPSIRETAERSGVVQRLTTVASARPRLIAGCLAFAIYLFSAWQVSPSIPGGDEPHYLVITQSLLLDGDLKIENNHRRGDYQQYFSGPLAPHYIQRGRNGEIYSIHAPGLSVLVLPAFAIGGYYAVVLELIVLAACGSALAWHLAWLATRRRSAAWFGWAAVTLSATTIFHSFTVYPDGVGAVIVLTGVWAIFRAADDERSGASTLTPWLLHGAALAALPWLHSRFALLAGSIGALVLLRLPKTRNPAGKAVAFLGVPAVSAICWMAFFVVIYGNPDPSAPYGASSSREFSFAFVPGGLTGLLFDQRFGLIANAPVLLCAIGGLAMMLKSGWKAKSPQAADAAHEGVADRRLAFELLFILAPYLVTATSYAMWWGGWSAPARFANPAVLVLAVPCAVACAGMRRRSTVAFAVGALAFTALLSFVLVVTDGGRLAYNTRETTALWLEWASKLTALGDGVPAWFRGREGAFARDVGIWAAMFGLAWWLTRRLESRVALRADGVFATAASSAYVVAGMAALSIVWSLHDATSVVAAPAQIDLLRAVSRGSGGLAVQLTPPRPLDRDRLLTMLRLEAPIRGGPGGMGRSEQPLATFSGLPAGRYRILPQARVPGGWLMVGVGQDQFALRSEALGSPPAALEIEFPVDVRALAVRGDEDARRGLRSVIVEPLAVTADNVRVTDRVARRAVKYGSATIFFLDDASFPEPEAFWVGGSRDSTIVVQPDQAVTSVPLLLRNAPVDNRITVTSGQWREALTLTPGEERALSVPIVPGRGAALVTISVSSGFRPSAAGGSRDARFLGVWVKP